MRFRLPEILILFGLCMALALPACLSPESGHPDRIPVPPTSMFFEKSYNFCSDVIQDRILVGYFGDDVLQTEVHFYVICHKGDTVYEDTWPATAHFEGIPITFPSDSAKIEFVQNNMRDMVTSTSPLTEIPLPDSLAQAMELGPQFNYRVGGNRNRSIAFSRKEKRVVVL